MAFVEFSRQEWNDFLLEHGIQHSDDPPPLWAAMQSASGRRVEEVMERVNRLVDAHGVEAIRQEGAHVDNYHYDIIATYVNMGDAYVRTLLYDTDAGAFYLTSYGDWYEEWEREHAPEEEEEEEEEERHWAFVWTPAPSNTLIAVLRSIEGLPLYVHLLDPSHLTQERDIRLGFSVESPIPGSFFADKRPDKPFSVTLAALTDAFQRKGHDDLYVSGITQPNGSVNQYGIERSQYERLMVAFDAAEETGFDEQPRKEFLKTPPVLWTCEQVNYIVWDEGEPGHNMPPAVEAFVAEFAEGLYGPDSGPVQKDLSVWSASGDELNELIEDGFIKWRDDASVRAYLKKSVGACR